MGLPLDLMVFRWLNGIAGAHDLLDHVVRLIAGDQLIPLISVMALVWLWLSGTDEAERSLFQRAALSGLGALGLASMSASILAIVVGRERPFVEMPHIDMLFYAPSDNSFPAHPISVVVAIGMAVRVAHRTLGNTIMSAGIAMGVARVIAGVYWPTDVIAGIAFGALIGASAHAWLDRIEPVPAKLTRALLGTVPHRAMSAAATTEGGYQAGAPDGLEDRRGEEA